jgi:Sulfotransferase domain
MPQSGNKSGPDLVICGAARAGTSFLASLLGSHPAIDPGSVKEPNFFSREFERGSEWYDRLFEPRERGLLRLDASMSYTYPHFPHALENVARHAPDAVMIYLVRSPLRRVLSHYQLHRDYFHNEPAATLGAALRSTQVYAGASDYARWLELLYSLFDDDRVVVAPFEAITGRTSEVLGHICSKSGLDPDEIDVESSAASQNRNQVVEFRHNGFRQIRRLARRSGAYPWIRRTVGADRLRSLRARVTRPVHGESLAEALATCDDEQLRTLEELYDSAQRAVATALTAQDSRTGLSWGPLWSAACPQNGSVALHQVESSGAGREHRDP